MEGKVECLVCIAEISQKQKVQLNCGHTFCQKCIVRFIETLRMYNQLRPEKLCCLADNCKQQIEDATISRLFPGQLGFIFNIIKKRYRQSKDPNMVIFDCKGYIMPDRKQLVARPQNITREEHSKKLNAISRQLIAGQAVIEGSKTCKNIFSHNKSVPRRQKIIVCMTCGCSFCVGCFGLAHDGGCPSPKQDMSITTATTTINKTSRDDFQQFVQSNHMLKCLNPKCQIPIEKQQGCFWIKCRCSWEMCYPCKKLWGDCEHFSKYPYSKFTPPPQWMVKALNLY